MPKMFCNVQTLFIIIYHGYLEYSFYVADKSKIGFAKYTYHYLFNYVSTYLIE